VRERPFGVADSPQAVVTDTHPLVFHAAGGRGLSPRAREYFQRCEEREVILYVPAAVIWECSLLARGLKVSFGRSIRSFFDDLFSNPAYHPLDLTLDQLYVADQRQPNRDPFDGLICAAAAALDLPLLTRDADITSSGIVKTLW
jgi:PIN domain nuclease of toxin-antitoxin system